MSGRQRIITQPDMTSVRAWVTVVSLLVAGAALRIVGLGERSMWLDETTAVRQASWSIPRMLAWMANNVHPPFFHTLLHEWILVFGRSEVAVRSYALVWGLAAIPLAYWGGRSLYDRRTGVFSAMLVALTPFFVWYSQETRMYTMLLVFALLSITAMWKALESPRPYWWWALYAVSVAAGLMTQYFFVFLLAGQAFYLFRLAVARAADFKSVQGRGRQESWLRRMFGATPALKWWLVAILCSLLPLVWWLPQVLVHTELFRGATGSFNYGGTPPKLGIYFNQLILVPAEAVLGFHSDEVMRNIVAMWPLLITMAFVFAGMIRRLDGASHFLGTSGVFGALLIIALGQWQPIILEVRYFTAVIAALAIASARFLVILRPSVRWALASVLLVTSLVSWGDQTFNPDSVTKWDNRPAMNLVAEGYRQGDAILLVPNFVSSIPEYYLPAEVYARVQRVPSFDAQGRPRNTPVKLAADLGRQVGPARRVWLISTWQETPRIREDTQLVRAWLLSQGFRQSENHKLHRITVSLYTLGTAQDFFIGGEGQ